DRHRELATPLQHDQAPRLNRIQATSTRGVRARIRRVAGCATPTGSAGHAGATANLKLTFHLDHSAGAGQFSRDTLHIHAHTFAQTPHYSFTSGRCRMRSNEATPLSSQAAASPSMMQERERRRASVSTISGKLTGEVIAGAAVEPHLRASLAGNDAEAVMLDFVNPQAAGRQGRP